MAASDPQTIGDAIHAAMFRRGDNQVEAARALDVTRQTINDWIKGRRVPSGKQATRLARYLGMTVADLGALRDRQTGRDIVDRLDGLEATLAKVETMLAAVLAALDQPPSGRSFASRSRSRS